MNESSGYSTCCDEWEQNIRKIDNFITLQFVRTGTQYDGVPFKYCPWCGKERIRL